MTSADVPPAQALSFELGWPHRVEDWELGFRHGEGTVAVVEEEVVGAGLRWCWGDTAATVGLLMVAKAWQRRGIGFELMSRLMSGIEERRVLLHATESGLGLYMRLGFRPVGELHQHQGIAQGRGSIKLGAGRSLQDPRPHDVDVIVGLDTEARGMPRGALIADLLSHAEAAVLLKSEGMTQGFGMLRRFGRGTVIGPVVALDGQGALAIVDHLLNLNGGHFTRIDIDAECGLSQELEARGLTRVDSATTMVRGHRGTTVAAARLFAVATQALG